MVVKNANGQKLLKTETSGYRPDPIGSGASWGMPGAYGMFRLEQVEDMRKDPQVQLCLEYKAAPIYTAEIEIVCQDNRVKEYLLEQKERFWKKSLSAALEDLAYGYNGSEALYYRKEGIYHFDYLKSFLWKDAKPRTWKGKLVCVRVGNIRSEPGTTPNTLRTNDQVSGAFVDLPTAGSAWPAKGVWYVHNPRTNPWYGRPITVPMWFPWRMKNMPDGILDDILKYAYKYSISCTVIRHPNEVYEGPDGNPVHSGDLARSMIELIKAGGVVALSSDRDEKGEYKYVIETWGEVQSGSEGLTSIADFYDKYIQRAAGIPDEVITHEGNTGGFSRSQIAASAYLIAAESDLNYILETTDNQIWRPCVKMNFGDVPYKIKAKPLILPDQQPGQQGQPQQIQPPDKPTQPSKPEALQFSAGDADDKLSTLHWGQIVSHEATHTRVVGPTASGKSMLAQAIAFNLEGKLAIIDPVWVPGNWGGLPAVTVSSDGNYAPIRQALIDLLNEMKKRGAELQKGKKDFERLNIIFDEVPDTIAEIPEAGEFIRRIAQRGRHANMHLIGIAQSSRVGSWGLEGYGDAAENFCTILLGSKAIEVMPDLAGTERPGVIEWRGKRYAIDMSEVPEMAKRTIPQERLFELPEAEMSDFNEEDHPRDESGEFTEKEGKGSGKESKVTDKSSEEKSKQDREDYKKNGVKSKAFKEWFGDWENDPDKASKIVDKDGKPEKTHSIPGVVYHGTKKKFNEFKLSKLGSGTDTGFLGAGFYFTNNERIANSYATSPFSKGSGKVISAYLSIKNPFEWGDKTNASEDLVSLGYPLPDKIHERVIKKTGFKFNSKASSSEMQKNVVKISAAIRDVLMEMGYDGIVAFDAFFKSMEYVAFHPHQIKSIDNLGTFDSSNPKIEMSSGEHFYSSTQFDFPKGIADKIKDYIKEIPGEDLAEEGREDEIHVTIKYGLHSDDSMRLRDILRGIGPVTITLGCVSVFEHEEQDVLKIDVYGADLFNLNRLISESVANTETWPTYKPHLTLAYLKKGKGKKYANDDNFDGIKITFDSLTFSPADGDKVNIPFHPSLVTVSGQAFSSLENITFYTQLRKEIREFIDNKEPDLFSEAGIDFSATQEKEKEKTTPEPTRRESRRNMGSMHHNPTGGHWVTIGAHSETEKVTKKNEKGEKVTKKVEGERHGGVHVFIKGDGVITKGPAKMLGKRPNELGHTITKHHQQTAPTPEAESQPESKEHKPPTAKPKEVKSEVKTEKAKPKKSKAKVQYSSYLIVDKPEIERRLKKLFPKSKNLNESLASSIGAPDDATVSINGGRDIGEVTVSVSHTKFKQTRTLNIDNQGRRFIHNDYFKVYDDYQNEGIGVSIFASQVENMIDEGFSHIETWAAGHKGHPEFNGYYTWPRFGYDQPLTDHPEAKAKFPNAKTVLDVMSTKEGRAWWMEHGSDLYHAKFDLTEGSRSRKVLEAYQQERKARR